LVPFFFNNSPTNTQTFVLVLLKMDDEAGSSTAPHSTTTAPGEDVGSVGQQLSKEGWLIKLSGYLVKSPKAPTPLFLKTIINK
jgi:hypothetical protein